MGGGLEYRCFPVVVNETSPEGVTELHKSGWRVFTDGGCYGDSPSSVGGSSSGVFVGPDGSVLFTQASTFTTEEMGNPYISSNISELNALLDGIATFILSGLVIQRGSAEMILCGDNLNALCWYTGEYSREGIIPSIVEKMNRVRRIQLDAGLNIRPVLMSGHPTGPDFKRGYKIKKGKRSIRYGAISAFNEIADKLCTAKMKERWD